MATSIPNNFLFIFLIIMNNYWKVKRPETEIEGSIDQEVFSTVKANIFEWVIELWSDGMELV